MKHINKIIAKTLERTNFKTSTLPITALLLKITIRQLKYFEMK